MMVIQIDGELTHRPQKRKKKQGWQRNLGLSGRWNVHSESLVYISSYLGCIHSLQSFLQCAGVGENALSSFYSVYGGGKGNWLPETV